MSDQSRENRSDSNNTVESMEKSLTEKRAFDTIDVEDHPESLAHEHASFERARRKKMKYLVGELQALLPHVHPKADKATIVGETLNYIKTLENTVEKLEKLKKERLQSASDPTGNTSEAFNASQGSSSTATPAATIPDNPVGFQTWIFSNVVLNICQEEAQFSICTPKKQGLFSAICCVLEKHNIEVLSAHISSDNSQSFFMIQAHANRPLDQISEAFSAEETFKKAARDIELWLS